MRKLLQPLLDFLSAQRLSEPTMWDRWQITPIRGGANSLVYRATAPDNDLAIKFMVRDSRQRAQREFCALTALPQSGLAIAPSPILLEDTCYAQSVMVQSWLHGQVIDAPPATEAEWQRLVEQHALIHSVAADKTDLPLRAVISPNSLAGCHQALHTQLQFIPGEKRTPELQALSERFYALPIQEWPTAPAMLCHDDANITNFVRRSGLWATVDWENSGWGDPTFDIADLMAHPGYMTVGHDRWHWVVQTYCDMIGQTIAARRIWIYYQMMLVWWVARLERALYEIPAGLDPRLVERPPTWQRDILNKRKHYVDRAVQLFESRVIH